MPIYETLNLEHNDGLACLTINRPKSANTLNRKLMQEFNEALDFLETDRDTRVVLLTGAGVNLLASLIQPPRAEE